MSPKHSRGRLGRARRNVIAGLFTFIPIWVTWLILDVLYDLLSNLGGPAARTLTALLRPYSPEMAEWIAHPWFRAAIAILLMLVLLFTLVRLAFSADRTLI